MLAPCLTHTVWGEVGMGFVGLQSTRNWWLCLLQAMGLFCHWRFIQQSVALPLVPPWLQCLWQGMGLAHGYGGSGGSPSLGDTPGSSLTCLWSRSRPSRGSSPHVVLCQTCFCGVELKSFILSGLIWKVNMLTSRQLSSGIWDFVPALPPSEAARGSALGVLFPGNGIAQSDESSACGVGSLTHGV